jgi:D-glycero-D-manno-heptose 1,7-bisphosphate phosphatase
LDRDGVINVDHAYVCRHEDFDWMPGVFDTARAAIELGLAVVVVTNQAGIARGYYDESQFLALTHWMSSAFEQAGAPLTAVYFCPYHPDGLPPYNLKSDRRKPAPGMLLQAAREHDIDLAASVLIGDQPTDVAAGRAAGVRNVALFGAAAAMLAPPPTDHVLPDHLAAVSWLRNLYGRDKHTSAKDRPL